MNMARQKLGVQTNAQAVARAALAGLFLEYLCLATTLRQDDAPLDERRPTVGG